MVKAVWEVDRQLAEISDSFDFLLQVTPVNAEAAWRQFQKTQFQKPPIFYYRPLAGDPAELKRRLYRIPVEGIEDPTLAHMFRQKQDELDRKITMLCDVGTPRLLYGSLQVYGTVTAELLELSQELLNRVPPRRREPGPGRQIGAAALAELAREEVSYYRNLYPDFQAKVVVRDDMYAGLLVSAGELLIGRQIRVPAGRVEALLQHEVGTHLVTYFNGRAQPFRQLDIGLAGYDSLQEGLAVLSEYLVGGLSAARIRLLAARVIAVQQVVDGATFIDTYRLLTDTYRFPKRLAYTIAMRVHRGGGLTKDILYLQGLGEILEYLRSGGEIEPLFVGKLAAKHIPVVRELQLRQVLGTPPLRPRYLDSPHIRERLDGVRTEPSILNLFEVKR
jgi:uncharacterized protein (TIGR02421 family)